MYRLQPNTEAVEVIVVSLPHTHEEWLMSRKREIVKWFQRLKGYGFIEAEDGAVDVFTHYTIDDSSNSFRHLYQNQELDVDDRRRNKRA